MKKLLTLTLSLFLCSILFAQVYNFESTLPSTFTTESNGRIALSQQKSKEGKQSLLWEWTGKSTLSIKESSVLQNASDKFGSRSGITLWIYVDQPNDKPLKFQFKDNSGNVQYQFDFFTPFKGWKACWIAFKDMWTPSGGAPSKQTIASMEILSPENSTNGKIFIDRFNIVNKVDDQATPDAQIPDNNRFRSSGNIWHWGRAWEWEQYQYDIPLPTQVSEKEKQDLNKIREAIKADNKGGKVGVRILNGMISNMAKWGIGVENAVGVKPLVFKYDVQYNASVDYDLATLITLLDQLARGWYVDEHLPAKTAFIDAMKWALDQGFTKGSAMGTNHHYGYDIRNIFPIVLWMQEPLREAGILDETAQAIAHWAGLPESRIPYDINRDELTDSWNTLLIGRLCSALLYETEAEQLQAMNGLTRWLSGSLSFTPGTIGGIKADGTGFHHGGQYPAYSVPGYASVGEVLNYLYGTDFNITQPAKETFKVALLATSNFSNKIDWGIGISGRHPLHNSMNKIGTKSQAAWGYLAKMFDPVDEELASTCIRISSSSIVKSELLNMGFTANENPTGFFPYNYACHGVFRDKDWTVHLKGYNKYVWGSEIYTADNRYGRYQSYGSIQLMTGSEIESRWVQGGWDWNRLPGTTTIHLPYNLLDSPLSGTLMAKSTETFSGVTSLKGKYGMFATKIKEGSWSNFTSSHVARKSAFCVGNRIICIGTGINNTNNNYPTETTLFQQNLNNTSESFLWKGNSISAFPYETTETPTEVTIMSDLTGNYYRIEPGQKISLYKVSQKSKADKSKADTEGNFACAYIDHGKAPDDAQYEYMIIAQPSAQEIEKLSEKPYTVLSKSNVAHIVEDNEKKVVGYALFEDYVNRTDRFIRSCDKETFVMVQYDEEHLLKMSVCDPNINLGDNSYTTRNPSVAILKTIEIKGKWQLKDPNEKIQINTSQTNTTLTVSCIDGLPVNFELIDSQYDSVEKEPASFISISTTQGGIILTGTAAQISIYDLQGKVLSSFHKEEGSIQKSLPRGMYIVKAQSENGILSEKIIL